MLDFEIELDYIQVIIKKEIERDTGTCSPKVTNQKNEKQPNRE